MTQEIVQHALASLLYEVVVNPKPGLVDPIDNGAHHDMDVFTFINSSLALENYLTAAEQIGASFTGPDLKEMFFKLRRRGKSAEQEMYAATKGVNTHKGAIFTLGIFVTARSFALKKREDTFTVIKAMCADLVQRDLENLKTPQTAGEKQFIKYGAGGVRQMAQNGYPVVKKLALPFLKKRKGTLNQRLLDTLMLIASATEDSTFIKRSGGLQNLNWLHQVCLQFLKLGGSETIAGQDFIKKENALFKQRNYSLGGCADLLIVTIFMALELGYL